MLGIGLVVVVGDALIKGFDLAIQIQRQLRLGGDVSPVDYLSMLLQALRLQVLPIVRRQ